MNINILTIFPEIFDALNFGVVSKSLDKELLKVETFDIRKNSINKHNQVDSKPYGGGEGMVMMAEPIINTLKEINNKLWVIEDDKRLCEKNSDFGDEFIKLSRDVHFLNDDRAKIKLEINNHTGSVIKEIKEYTSY